MDALTPIRVLIVGIVAAAFALAVTPILRAIAIRRHFIDQPDRQRKLHRQPVALGGGLSVLLAVWATIAVVTVSNSSIRELVADQAATATGILLASCLIVLLGLVDDRYGLRGR